LIVGAVIFAQSLGSQDPAQNKGAIPPPQNDSFKTIKVAVIDSQKALEQSTEGQKLLAKAGKLSKKKLEEDLGRIRTEMVDLVQKLAKEKGYSLILDLKSSGIICYLAPVDDLTDALVERYNSLIR
jgi:Skp family chaperone for outer membrane proteins